MPEACKVPRFVGDIIKFGANVNIHYSMGMEAILHEVDSIAVIVDGTTIIGSILMRCHIALAFCVVLLH